MFFFFTYLNETIIEHKQFMSLKKWKGKLILPDCPVEITLQLLNDKRKILVVRELLTGTRRFGELRRNIAGISQKVLTDHLRAMEESNLVRRKVYAQVPPKVEYSLTETGRSLLPVIEAMAAWGNEYRAQCAKKDARRPASAKRETGSRAQHSASETQEAREGNGVEGKERQLIIPFD